MFNQLISFVVYYFTILIFSYKIHIKDVAFLELYNL